MDSGGPEMVVHTPPALVADRGESYSCYFTFIYL